MLNTFMIIMAICSPMLLVILINRQFTFKINQELNLIQQQINQDSLPEMREEISALKKRVVTLEAIVTSHGYDVNEKISNL